MPSAETTTPTGAFCHDLSSADADTVTCAWNRKQLGYSNRDKKTHIMICMASRTKLYRVPVEPALWRRLLEAEQLVSAVQRLQQG